MTSRIAALSPARSSRNGLFMIPLLILSVPFLRSVSPQAPEPVTVPAIFEGATDAARLSWILASLRDIRDTAERSAADKPEASYTALGWVPATAFPTGLPVLGTVSSEFGLRVDPFSGLPEFHKGIDIAAARGTPVSATTDGEVLWAGWRGNYGKTVILGHPHGHETRYAHLDRILVRGGDPVRKGTVIGTVGDTGRATGTHLHYEVLCAGKRTNPRTYMLGVTVGGKEPGQ